MQKPGYPGNPGENRNRGSGRGCCGFGQRRPLPRPISIRPQRRGVWRGAGHQRGLPSTGFGTQACLAAPAFQIVPRPAGNGPQVGGLRPRRRRLTRIKRSGMKRPGASCARPSATRTGARNPFYETMREVSPGDVVFSFVKTPAPSVMRASLVFGSIGRIEQAHGQTPVEIETNVDRSKGTAREP